MKTLLAGFALAVGLVASAFAAYPDKPVTIIVPFPPGGSTDMVARAIAPKLQEQLGQPFVIDNRAGATGAIGATAVKNAAPDGYTFMVASIGVYAVNPFIQKKLQYDPVKDLDPITVAVRAPNVLVTSPNFRRQVGPRADRAAEEVARQDHVRVVGCGFVRPPDGRAVLAEDRARAASTSRTRAARRRSPTCSPATPTCRSRTSTRSSTTSRPASSRCWPSPATSVRRCCRKCRRSPRRACRASTCSRGKASPGRRECRPTSSRSCTTPSSRR